MANRNPRDDLRVPTEFDGTRTGFGERAARRMAHNLRAAHNSGMELQFNQTIAILRFTITAPGSPARGVSPTRAQVLSPDLSALPAEVGGFRMREIVREGEKVKVSTREFVLYNVPEWTNPTGDPVARVLQTDVIDFRGDTFDVLEVDPNPETGRQHVIGELRSTPP